MGKKIIALLLSLCILFGLQNGLIYQASAANGDSGSTCDINTYLTQLDTKPVIPVVRASGLSIDGDLKDWDNYGKISLPYNASQNHISNYGGTTDLSAQASFASDDNNFYFAITVTDNVYNAFSGSGMWKGDSIQMAFSSDGVNYGSEYGFACVNGAPSVWCWNPGTSTGSIDSINLQVSRSGSDTFYEAAIPWNVMMSQAPVDNFKMSFVVNENDGGSSRRGYIELTPGIASSKDATTFATLELNGPSHSLTSWIAGPSKTYTNTETQYKLYIMNMSNTEATINYSIAATEQHESIKLNANSVYIKTFPITITESGQQNITAVVSDTASGRTENPSLSVEVIKDPAIIKKSLDDLAAKLPQLQALLQQCKDAGIPVDYETVDYTTIQRFLQYGYDDLNQDGYQERAAYVADTIESLYEKATDSLNAYLAKTKEALVSPRFQTGDISLQNHSYIGTAINPLTGQRVTQPLFFLGYGHFGQVKQDIPNFSNFGTNAIQIETGPSSVILNPVVPQGWSISKKGTIDASCTMDYSVSKSGNASMHFINNTPKASNVYINAYQTIPVTPNTTYTISAWFKGENVKNVWFPGGASWATKCRVPDGTFDWTQKTVQYTTGSNETSFTFMILCENTTANLWVDDVSMTANGSEVNIVNNPAFDNQMLYGNYSINTSTLNDLKTQLQKATDSNIIVNLLLSPHYFPTWVLNKYPDLKSSNVGFLTYDIFDPRAKDVIQAYLETVVQAVKDYPSLFTLTLTNEVQFDTRCSPTAVSAWHDYLSNIYSGNIGILNQIYAGSYTSFNDVPMPATIDSSPQAGDWVAFNDEMLSGWHQWMADVIHSIAPDIPVQVKVMHQSTLQNSAISKGVDIEQFSKLSQINGSDQGSYLDEGAKGYLNEEMYYDLQYSMNNVPVFNSEDHVIKDKDTNYSPIQAAHVVTNLWQSAVHGKNAETLWIWERSYDPNSTRAGSVLARPDVVDKIGRICLDLNRLAYEVTSIQNVKADAAILYSRTSQVYASDYIQTMENAYQALTYNGQKVGFVSEDQVAENKLNDYKILIVPHAPNVSASTLAGINSFVERGGRVVLLGNDTIGKDEHNQVQEAAELNAVLNTAEILPVDITVQNLRDTLLNDLNTLGLNRVMIFDKSTGLPVTGVEWLSSQYNGKTLINVANYDMTAKNISIQVDGREISKCVDLISGNELSPDSITLNSLTPMLLSVDPVTITSTSL